MTQQACIVHHLTVQFSHQSLFEDLNFQLPFAQASALIGRNGQGKSLLMSALHVSKLPDYATGQIDWQCPHAYLAQLQRIQGKTIADALGIHELYHCFLRIEQGEADFSDYDQVENLWYLPQEWQKCLENADLPTDLSVLVEGLSEGQKTKLTLCRLFLLKDHYLLLDEPSNHLDTISKQWLMMCLQQHPSGCLVVSHDRTLLNQMQNTFALNEFSLTHFHCNYASYQKQVDLQYDALQRKVDQESKILKQLNTEQHQTLMKTQKRQKFGERLKQSGSQAKILLDFNKESASKSHSKLVQQQNRKKEQIQTDLRDKQQSLEKIKPQKFDFQMVDASSDEILRLNQVKLPFSRLDPIDLSLQANQKIHIIGKNGVGKSILLKVIQGELTALSGQMFKSVNSFYLDQTFSCLDHRLSAVENLQKFNSKMTSEQCRTLLGKIRLRREKTLLPVASLSGGEQLKVALTAISICEISYGILLLDEPDNHLDIESKQLFAHAIKSFQGAILLVSHDSFFVKDSGITSQHNLSLLNS